MTNLVIIIVILQNHHQFHQVLWNECPNCVLCPAPLEQPGRDRRGDAAVHFHAGVRLLHPLALPPLWRLHALLHQWTQPGPTLCGALPWGLPAGASWLSPSVPRCLGWPPLAVQAPLPPLPIPHFKLSSGGQHNRPLCYATSWILIKHLEADLNLNYWVATPANISSIDVVA